MLRHIIFEGPDGGGKDTAIGRLMKTAWGDRFDLHERASRSESGPVEDLAGWVTDDNHLLTTTPQCGPFVYNRHPLISELIYADLRKVNPGRKGQFAIDSWVEVQRRTLASHAILVLCLPPVRVVQDVLKNQNPKEQMPGVVKNIKEIHQRYMRTIGEWPGVCLRYDRTIQHFPRLIQQLKMVLDGSYE